MSRRTRSAQTATVELPPELTSASLYEAFGDKIRGYIRSMTRDPDEADDLTQETFLRVHRALSSLQDRDAVVAWLYRIATRVCYDRFRQSSGRPVLETFEAGPSEPAQVPWSDADDPRLDKALERAEMSHCVREYLDGLSNDYRTAIILHDLEGATNPQIANMLGISLDAAKIHVYRARRKLQEALSGDCDFYFDESGIFVCEPKPR
jgi:RNA polymerase sigma-70 factor (ECF subfamily)